MCEFLGMKDVLGEMKPAFCHSLIYQKTHSGLVHLWGWKHIGASWPHYTNMCCFRAVGPGEVTTCHGRILAIFVKCEHGLFP
jgi:hypothetical protein